MNEGLGMAKDKKIDALKGVGLFSACSDRELKFVAAVTDRVDVEPGSVLIEEGSAGHDLWIIADGTATVSQRRRTVRTAGPGDVLGELSLLDGEPRSATVTAKTPVIAYVVNARSFRSMVKEAPSVALKIMQSMATRLRRAEAPRPRR